MRDPGYISEAAWNQEAPYRDADNYDRIVDEVLEDTEDRSLLESRSVWLHRAVTARIRAEREDFLPPRLFAPGVVPASTDCRGKNPSAPVGAPSPAGASSKP